MGRHEEDRTPQRGIIGGSTPHCQWLVGPSRAHTENLRTVERSIKMHQELMDSPLPPSALPPRRRVEGNSPEHKKRLETELTSVLDLTPFQVANHGNASAIEVNRQNRKMQPHMRSEVDELVFGRDLDGSTLEEARGPIRSDILAPAGRLPLKQSLRDRPTRTPRKSAQVLSA